MTAAYLTEPEIIRELRLPERVGRAFLAQWKLSQTFPRPVQGMNGRRFWPAVERWLLHHERVTISEMSLPVADGQENFDAFKGRRRADKASKAAGPRNPRSSLPPAPGPVAANVVTTLRFGEKGLPRQDVAPVATVGGDPASA